MSCCIIQGVSVAADYTIPQNKIKGLVCEIIKTWQWEGKELGRIELIRCGQMINVVTFEKPVSQVVPIE